MRAHPAHRRLGVFKQCREFIGYGTILAGRDNVSGTSQCIAHFQELLVIGRSKSASREIKHCRFLFFRTRNKKRHLETAHTPASFKNLTVDNAGNRVDSPLDNGHVNDLCFRTLSHQILGCCCRDQKACRSKDRELFSHVCFSQKFCATIRQMVSVFAQTSRLCLLLTIRSNGRGKIQLRKEPFFYERHFLPFFL